jgi:hypothetical protein
MHLVIPKYIVVEEDWINHACIGSHMVTYIVYNG